MTDGRRRRVCRGNDKIDCPHWAEVVKALAQRSALLIDGNIHPHVLLSVNADHHAAHAIRCDRCAPVLGNTRASASTMRLRASNRRVQSLKSGGCSLDSRQTPMIKCMVSLRDDDAAASALPDMDACEV